MLPCHLFQLRVYTVLLCSCLGKSNLKHSSIKAYLSAVWFLHIAEGFSDPFLPSLQKLQYTLCGIKKCEAEKSGNKKERLPVGPGLLRLVRKMWNANI